MTSEEDKQGIDSRDARPRGGLVSFLMEHKWWTAIGAMGTVLTLIATLYACTRPPNDPNTLRIQNGNCNAQGGSGNSVSCGTPQNPAPQ